MSPSPSASTDGYRLAALRLSRLLDTPPEPAFDRLTALVRRILDAPVALFSLVDDDRQFFKSQQGLAEPWASRRGTPLSHSFCQHVVASDAPLVIEDARTHPVVRDNLAISDLGVVAYFGVPVHSPDGYALGSLCAIDTEPRAWTDDDRVALLDLAAIVETEILLRGSVAAYVNAEARCLALFDASPDAVLLLEPLTEAVLDANGPACVLYGLAREAFVERTMKRASSDALPGEDAVAGLLATGGVARFESVHLRADGRPFDVATSASVVQFGDRPVVISVNRDVTDRNRAAQALRASLDRAAFRETLGKALRPLTDPGEIQAWATRVLGEHLGAARVFYAHVDPDSDRFTVLQDYSCGMASVRVVYALSDYGPAVASALRDGQTQIVGDFQSDPGLTPTERAANVAHGVSAYIAVPHVKGGRLVGLLTVHHAAPHAWAPEEVALVRATAEQTWAVTDRERALGALAASEARFRQIAETLPQLVWTTDAAGQVDYMNGRLYAYTGMEASNPPLEWAAYAHPDDLARCLPQWLQSIATGEPYEVEYRIRGVGAGEYRWFIVRAEPVRDASGRIVQWFGTSTDIHDLREARERLRTDGERLRLVQRATDDIIWDLDVETGAIEWNPAAVRQLGWPELAGVTDVAWWENRIHPDDLDRVAASLAVLLDGDQPSWQEEYRFRRADGTEAYVLDRGYVVRGQSGEATRVVGAMIDLSGRKAFEVAREAAEAAGRLKSCLLANMSHEIRTPLTAIIGYAELLGEEAGPDLNPLVEPIERGGKRLLATLNSVLDLAQIEAGELRIHAEPVDLRDEVEQVCELLRPLALARGLDLQVRGAAVHALADRTAVGRVLSNLVGNAIKFTESGTVTVEVGTYGDQACFRVCDTGVGIAEAFLPALFEEFKQESEGHQRTHEGSGLGLAITQRLVGLMRGEIAVESAKDRGSVFTVRLQLAAEPAGVLG